MDQSEENKTEIKDRVLNFFNDNKKKNIYFYIYFFSCGSFVFFS